MRRSLKFCVGQIMGVNVGKDNLETSSLSNEAYRKQLAQIFNMNRTLILTYKNKPPTQLRGFSKNLHLFTKRNPPSLEDILNFRRRH